MAANTAKIRRSTIQVFQRTGKLQNLHTCHQNWELISRTKPSETALEL